MITKSLAAVFVFTVFLCASALRASGQSQQCIAYPSCGWYSFDSGCLPILPPTAYDCQTSGPFTAVCKVKTNGCHPIPECPSCNTAGNPIDLASGNTNITQTDVRVPGLGGGLSLARTWNSMWPPNESAYRQGLFGPNWRSTYEERIFTGNDGFMKYSRGDGSFWSFGYTGNNNNSNYFGVASPANQTATLVGSTTNWALTFQNGEQRVFDIASGFLLSITDRNGNTTQLSYDSSSRLASVTDPAGRHLYFSYANPSSYVVSAITSDVGLSLSYSYDTQGRLVQVTKPDATTVSFQYDSNSYITAVLDSNNKVLESHTYDSQGRGLTSSRAGGVEAVTISYPQPPPPI